MSENQGITVDIDINLSFWNAIKLRIAGLTNVHKYLDNKGDLECDLDGNCLSIVRKDFINLAESPSIFITLTKKQIKDIERLKKGEMK